MSDRGHHGEGEHDQRYVTSTEKYRKAFVSVEGIAGRSRIKKVVVDAVWGELLSTLVFP